MKRIILGIGLVALTAAFSLVSAIALAADRQKTQFGGSARNEAAQVPPASELMDKTVKNQQGENLGKIIDVIFTREGQISYLILGEGGVLGLGEKYFPVPFKNLVWNQQQDTLILPDVTRESLKGAPTVKKNEWAQLEDPIFERKVNTYYSQLQSVPQRTP